MPEMTRADRRTVTARLDEFAREIAQIGHWLDQFGDDADKASLLCESASRDLLASAWLLRPADHERLPLGWQSVTDQ